MILLEFLKKIRIFHRNIPFNEKETRMLEEYNFILNEGRTSADDASGDQSNLHATIKTIKKTLKGYEAHAFVDVFSPGNLYSFLHRAGQKKVFPKLKLAIEFLRDQK
jgi:phage tail sheath gpL-like